MRTRRLAAPFVAALLLLAACGDDGESVDPEADQDAADAAVEEMVEELEDDGFVAEEDDDDDDDSDIEFDSEECQDFDDALDDGSFDDASGNAETGQLAAGTIENDGSGGETTVEGKAALVADEGDVDEVFELFGDDRLGDCLVEAFETSFAEQAAESGLEAVDIEFEELDAPSVGEDAFAFEITGDLEVQGLSVPFRSTLVTARDGRAAVQVTVTEVGDDGPGADGDDLAELLLDELTAE